MTRVLYLMPLAFCGLQLLYIAHASPVISAMDLSFSDDDGVTHREHATVDKVSGAELVTLDTDSGTEEASFLFDPEKNTMVVLNAETGECHFVQLQDADGEDTEDGDEDEEEEEEEEDVSYTTTGPIPEEQRAALLGGLADRCAGKPALMGQLVRRSQSAPFDEQAPTGLDTQEAGLALRCRYVWRYRCLYLIRIVRRGRRYYRIRVRVCRRFIVRICRG